MAGTSLLALLDDITALLDGVAALTKIAAKKTAGVLGDDLALNAEQVTGVAPARELRVVWAVAKGSLVNKLILVPSALGLSIFLPWTITPLLMLGGAFLCFEGFEKVHHKLFHARSFEVEQQRHAIVALDPQIDLLAFENEKIQGAVRTDFVLSAEIIVITLGTLEGQTWGLQVTTLATVAALMTVGVYGLVAGIVKLDDLGLWLSRKPSAGARRAGSWLLAGAPLLMRLLSVAGTAAMFLVGGEILAHGLPPLRALTLRLDAQLLGWLWNMLLAAVTGLVAGAVLVGLFALVQRWRRRPAPQRPPTP